MIPANKNVVCKACPSVFWSGKIIFKDRFVLPEDGQVRAMGVAVFAQDVKTGVVLQAMAAPLCVVK